MPWVDTFFSLLIIFMAALLIVKILWGIATKEETTMGLPENINWGCGAIIGLILAGILFWGASSGGDATITAWVLGGGIIGFLLSFMPGHPLM